MFQGHLRFTPGSAEPRTPRPGRLLSDEQRRSSNTAGPSRAPGNSRGAARAQPDPPVPRVCPGLAPARPVVRGTCGAQGAAAFVVFVPAEPVALPRIFPPADSGRSRRPGPQSRPRGSCRERRGLRRPETAGEEAGHSFGEGRRRMFGSRGFSEQAERRIPRRGRECWCCRWSPRPPLPPPRHGRAPAGRARVAAGPLGGGARLYPQLLWTAAAAAPNQPHRTPKPPRRRRRRRPETTGAPTCGRRGGRVRQRPRLFSTHHAYSCINHASFPVATLVGGAMPLRGAPIGGAARPSRPPRPPGAGSKYRTGRRGGAGSGAQARYGEPAPGAAPGLGTERSAAHPPAPEPRGTRSPQHRPAEHGAPPARSEAPRGSAATAPAARRAPPGARPSRPAP